MCTGVELAFMFAAAAGAGTTLAQGSVDEAARGTQASMAEVDAIYDEADAKARAEKIRKAGGRQKGELRAAAVLPEAFSEAKVAMPAALYLLPEARSKEAWDLVVRTYRAESITAGAARIQVFLFSRSGYAVELIEALERAGVKPAGALWSDTVVHVAEPSGVCRHSLS
jgi:hypothetical protein